MVFIRKNFFTIAIIALMILTVSACLTRFLVLKDYDVTYEVECDPYAEQCFVSCEDDACDEVYHYKYITTHATELFDFCGPDITECETASTCIDGQIDCEVTFCSPQSDECDNLTWADKETDLGEAGEADEVTEVIEINEDL